MYAVYGDAFTGSTEVVSRGPPVVRKSILVEELKVCLFVCLFVVVGIQECGLLTYHIPFKP